MTHIVHVDRRRNFSSPTLGAEQVRQLESTFQAVPRWRDRWTNHKFIAAARAVLRAEGSLVLVGPGMSFEIPPPFVEMFEPIEIAGLESNRDRLKILSGSAPTRQERFGGLAGFIIGALGIGVAGFLVFAMFNLPPAIPATAGTTLLLTGVIVALAVLLQRRGGRWFLVPGGLAILRRPVRAGQPPRITVFSRPDSCLVYRYVHTGKTVMLVLELWTHAEKVLRRPVSEREAISILAAWQSPHPPPPDQRLEELLDW